METVYKSLPKLKIRPDIILYNCVLNGFATSGDLDKLKEYFHQLLENSHSSSSSGSKGNLSPNITSFNVLLKGFARKNQLEAIEKCYHMLTSKYSFEPNEVTFATIMTAFLNAGNTTK